MRHPPSVLKLSLALMIHMLAIQRSDAIPNDKDPPEETVAHEAITKTQQAALSLTDEPAFVSAEMQSKLSKYDKAMAAARAKKPKPNKLKQSKSKKKSATESVSYETNAEQFEILTEFYAELKEDKTADDIQAILDKRRDEGADALTKPQFEELCAKLKVKKFIDPIELWAEKHPPPEEEEDASEDEDDSGGGGWFSGWGGGEAGSKEARTRVWHGDRLIGDVRALSTSYA